MEMKCDGKSGVHGSHLTGISKKGKTLTSRKFEVDTYS